MIELMHRILSDASAAARPCRHGAAALALALLPAMLGALPAPAAAQELGRLFFTPQQRQDLDRRRASNAQAVITVTPEDRVTVNGQVTRSGGPRTTWINGQPQESAGRSASPAAVTLPQGENQPPVTLKIGETLDRVRGETQSGLAGGSVTVKPSPK